MASTAVVYNLDIAWTANLGYVLIAVSGWCALRSDSRSYSMLAVAFLASTFVSTAAALLDIATEVPGDAWLQSLLIVWAVVERPFGSSSLPTAARHPVALAVVAALLGFSIGVYPDGWPEWSASVSLSAALPFLGLLLGLSGRGVPIAFAVVILLALAAVSEAMELQETERYLLESDVEIFWEYTFAGSGEFLAMLLLGWAIFIRHSGYRPGLHWLTSLTGLAMFSVLGLLHTSAQVGVIDLSFPGSAVLSLTAVFVCGWYYGKHAQIIGLGILAVFLAVEYWDAIYEVARAQEDSIGVQNEEGLEEIVITVLGGRAGLSLFEVALLPAMAFLGEQFRGLWEESERRRRSDSAAC